MGHDIDTLTALSTRTLAGVVVNYNYEPFLRAAVRSLLDQSDSFDQVIVVDDGSTDGSLAALSEFGQQIEVIAKENGGPLSAALAAVARTDCDYFYLLDADDVADPELVATIRPLLSSDPVKVQFQLRSIDVHGADIDSVFPSFKSGYSSRDMVNDNERLGFYVCAPTSGNVFRTDYLAFLSTMGLNEREAYDGVPAQLAPYFGEIISLNRPFAFYRVHETSLSAWSQPTPALMRRELSRYENRWRDGLRVLVSEGKVAPDPSRSAYILERELMVAVLEGHRPSMRTAWAYASATLLSGRSLPQRIAFSAWGFALVVLPRAQARDLAISKRSVAKRGLLSSLVAKLARARA